MRYIVAIALLMLAPVDASAKKCIARFFEVSGTVIGLDGQPASGAIVGVSWEVAATPKGPALASTNDQGEFLIPVRIAPHECGPRTIKFTVSAYTSSHYAQSETVRTVPGTSAVAVPPLRIASEIHRSPVWPDEAGG